MAIDLVLSNRADEQFYQDYVAACDEIEVAPLQWHQLVALLEALAKWPTATFQ